MYKIDDFAPLGCNDCRGCHSCCTNMGDSIIQDPYDYWLFSRNMKIAGGGKVTFDMLVSEDGPWELSDHDGVLLPNIKMVEEGRCPFLDESGRCSIHMLRSGLCRLFPLGRVFEEDGTISYTLLKGSLGCRRSAKGKDSVKVKIREWLGYAFPEKYEEYQVLWHEIKKQVSAKAEKFNDNECSESFSDFLVDFLECFYTKAYGDDFFGEFKERARYFTDKF